MEWGMALIDDDEELLRQFGGVPVSNVTPGSPAEAAGIAAGDLISHVAGQKVGSMQPVAICGRRAACSHAALGRWVAAVPCLQLPAPP